MISLSKSANGPSTLGMQHEKRKRPSSYLIGDDGLGEYLAFGRAAHEQFLEDEDERCALFFCWFKVILCKEVG